jgi:hypothetical protein
MQGLDLAMDELDGRRQGASAIGSAAIRDSSTVAPRRTRDRS